MFLKPREEEEEALLVRPLGESLAQNMRHWDQKIFE